MLSAKNPINRKVRVEYNAILSINSGKKLLIVENVNTTNVSHGCFVSSRVVHAKIPLPARHIPCCKAKAKTQSKTASGDTSILIVRRPRSQEGKPRYCDVMGTSIDVWSAMLRDQHVKERGGWYSVRPAITHCDKAPFAAISV